MNRQLTPIVAGVLAALLEALALVPAAGGVPTPDYVDGDYLFIATSEYDYTGGGFTLMDMNAPWPHANNYGTLSGDAVARDYGGLIYVINRWGGDNIQVLDPGADFATVLQFSTGPGSNPQDIAFVDAHRAFVSRYERADLWEVDPATGEHTDSIDLSPLADADGIPEMWGLAICGQRLLVGLQRLDRDHYWLPVAPSYLAVVDLNDNSLIDMDPDTPGLQGIALAAPSPNSWLISDRLRGEILVGEVGCYGEQDGGIERLDPLTGESRGFVVEEGELGGDVHVWGTGGGLRGFAVVIGADWSTRIVAFDLLSGEVLGTVCATTEYAYTHLLVDPARRQLFVCDRSYANPGVRVFDTESLAPLTPAPIGVGLYPFWLLGMHGPESGVEESARAGLPRLRILPQPAAGDPLFRFHLSAAGWVRLEVYDPCGRRVLALPPAALPRGEHAVSWPPDAGRLESGTYLARLQTPEGAVTGSFRVVR